MLPPFELGDEEDFEAVADRLVLRGFMERAVAVVASSMCFLCFILENRFWRLMPSLPVALTRMVGSIVIPESLELQEAT